MDKAIEIWNYSDPLIVFKKCKQLLNNDQVYLSNRRDKKYMILDKKSGKFILHFGQMGFQDLTFHKDKKRRELFQKRNFKWKDANKYTPSWLAYHILW